MAVEQSEERVVRRAQDVEEAEQPTAIVDERRARGAADPQVSDVRREHAVAESPRVGAREPHGRRRSELRGHRAVARGLQRGATNPRRHRRTR
jgi:hypothetical protein